MPDEFTRTGAAWALRPVFPVERYIFMDHHNCLLVKFVFIFGDLDIIFGYFYIIFSAFNIILGAFYIAVLSNWLSLVLFTVSDVG